MGQEWPGHIHRVIYPSEPGNFHTVQSQQAQPLPGAGALHRCCLQRDLEARQDDENGTREVKALDTQVTPEPRQVCPSPAREGLELSPGIRNHLHPEHPTAAAAQAEELEGEQEAVDAEEDLHGLEQEGDGPEG